MKTKVLSNQQEIKRELKCSEVFNDAEGCTKEFFELQASLQPEQKKLVVLENEIGDQVAVSLVCKETGYCFNFFAKGVENLEDLRSNLMDSIHKEIESPSFFEVNPDIKVSVENELDKPRNSFKIG